MPASSTSVSAHIECRVTETAELVFSVAVAAGASVTGERLDCTLDGRPFHLDEVAVADGGRLHVARNVPPGGLVLDYRATAGSPAAAAPATSCMRRARRAACAWPARPRRCARRPRR